MSERPYIKKNFGEDAKDRSPDASTDTSINELETWDRDVSAADMSCTLYRLNNKDIRKKIYGFYFDIDYKSAIPHVDLHHDLGPNGPQVKLMGSNLVAALRPCKGLYYELLDMVYDNQRSKLSIEDSRTEEFLKLCPAALRMVRNLSIHYPSKQYPDWFQPKEPSKISMEILKKLSHAPNIRALSLTIPISEEEDVFRYSLITNVLKTYTKKDQHALRELYIHLEDLVDPVRPGDPYRAGANERLEKFGEWVCENLGRVTTQEGTRWCELIRDEDQDRLSVYWGLIDNNDGAVYPRASIFWAAYW